MTDHFVPVPLRFLEALTAGALDPGHFIVGVLIAHRCYENRNTAEGVATVRLIVLADLCNVSPDTIQRKLEDLRERGWIDFERPGQGQRVGWQIWLTGLAREDSGSAPPPHDLRTTSAPDPPPVRNSSSAGHLDEWAAIPHGETARAASRPPQAADAELTDETRRDDKRTTKSKPISEGEKKDHVLGKTTAADRNGVDGDRLLSDAESRKMDAELRKMAQAETLRRHEASENERRFLAECQQLVDASIASWIDDEARDAEPDEDGP